MNWYGVLQSVIVYALTGFSVACATWAAKTSKRITILEEHDKAQQDRIDSQSIYNRSLESKLDEIVKAQTEMSTKIDLILKGQLRLNNQS